MIETLGKEEIVSMLSAVVYQALEDLKTDSFIIPMADERRANVKIDIEFAPDRIVFSRTPAVPVVPTLDEQSLAQFIEMLEFISKVEKDVAEGKMNADDVLTATLVKSLLAPLFAKLKCHTCDGKISIFSENPRCESCGSTYDHKEIFFMGEAAFDSRS